MHTPYVEDIGDWRGVKERIDERAPDIAVRIVNNRLSDDEAAEWQITRPSLLLSSHELRNFRPRGGKVYTGIGHDKMVQFERLARAGLPTPPTMPLSPDTRLPPDWGPLLAAKPLNSKFGALVSLVSTADLVERQAELTAGGTREMIVQPFVDHVDAAGRPSEFRVLLIFGRVVYAARNFWPRPRGPLAELLADPARSIASNRPPAGRPLRELAFDEDVIELARLAAAVFPEVPVVAVDIVRANATGALVVLEVNPRGESWHLSSNFARHTFEPAHRAALYAQFGALDVIADALIEKTRSEAV